MQPNILTIIADNAMLSAALREVLEKQFYLPDHSDLNHTNEELGAVTRACLLGLQCVDAAFKEIEMYKTIERKPDTLNPGR